LSQKAPLEGAVSASFFTYDFYKFTANLSQIAPKIDTNKVTKRCWHKNAIMFSWDHV
jgi:hypothetical protein